MMLEKIINLSKSSNGNSKMILFTSIIYFRSSDEVLHILGNILGSLQRGRTSLIVPRKRAMDDLIKSRNMVNSN